jgi:peptidase M48-like protein
MVCQLATFLASSAANAPLLRMGILIFPILLTLCFREIALNQQAEMQRKRVWGAYREFGRLLVVITVAVGWVTWDLGSRNDLLGVIGLRNAETSSVEAVLFWLPPIVSLGIFLLWCRTVDKIVLRLKWSIGQTLQHDFGMRNAIVLADNLGKYLTKPQKGYVIAHELAHIKLRHSRKHLLLVMAIFCITTLLLFGLPKQASPPSACNPGAYHFQTTGGPILLLTPFRIFC